MENQVHLYKYRPDNGENADEFDRSKMSDDSAIELAAMFRNGAKFYWTKSDDGLSWEKVELSNIRFVVEVTGRELVTHDTVLT